MVSMVSRCRDLFVFEGSMRLHTTKTDYCSSRKNSTNQPIYAINIDCYLLLAFFFDTIRMHLLVVHGSFEYERESIAET